MLVALLAAILGAPAVPAVDDALLALPPAALALSDSERRAMLKVPSNLVDREHGYLWAHRNGDIDFVEAALFVGTERTLLVLKTARSAKKAWLQRGPVTLRA